jgi:hypothetical protein
MMEIKRYSGDRPLRECSKALPLVTSLSGEIPDGSPRGICLGRAGHFGAWYGEFDRSEIEKMQALERKKAEEKLDEICTLHLNHCPLYIRHTAVGDPASEILKLFEKERWIWW